MYARWRNLNADYVASLSAGKHSLEIVSESGTATAHFTVNEKKKAAATKKNTKENKTKNTAKNTTKNTPTKAVTKSATRANSGASTGTTASIGITASTGTSATTTTKSSPQTGDSTDMQGYLILIFASITGIVGIVRKRENTLH